MKKTTKLLIIGFSVMISAFIVSSSFVERIIPASLFIVSAGFYVEAARLMLIQSK